MSGISLAVSGASLLALISIATGAVAQEKFPSRPIQMIVPVAPGGGVDASFRALAELVEPVLGQRVVVVNRPGASGTLGVDLVIQSAPDGYTVGGVWNAPLTMAPHIIDVRYSAGDYEALGMVTTAPMTICAKENFAAKTGKELIELMRANPNKYTYGTDGVGGIVHLSFERIFNKMGVQARAIAHKGAGESLVAFLGNHIDLYGGTIAPMQPHMEKGSVRCLIVTSADRNAAAPQAASLKDLGIPNEATANWRGVIAPKGIAPDRRAILEKAFLTAAGADGFKKLMESRGEEAKPGTASEMQQLLKSEYTAFATVIRAIGLAKK